MKFLIAGLGSIGRRHLHNLTTLGEDDIVLYRTGKSTLPDQELAQYSSENTLEGALAHHPDAVIVSNPTAFHLDVAIPAARAGCHLLIEKPISHSMERIDELRTAVQEGGGKVLVGFQYRFHPGIRAVKQALDEGRIGNPVYARAHWGEYLPDWHPWEDYRNSYAARNDLGGGVTLTLCHPFDYLRFLFGEVLSETGWVEKTGSLDLTVEDMAEVNLLMTAGMRASVHLNYLERPARHQLDVLGTEGGLNWQNDTGRVIVNSPSGVESIYFDPGKDFERNTLFLKEMEHFIAVIRQDFPSLCSLDDGVEALKIALTIKNEYGR